jgi:hypothetical protein
VLYGISLHVGSISIDPWVRSPEAHFPPKKQKKQKQKQKRFPSALNRTGTLEAEEAGKEEKFQQKERALKEAGEREEEKRGRGRWGKQAGEIEEEKQERAFKFHWSLGAIEVKYHQVCVRRLQRRPLS